MFDIAYAAGHIGGVATEARRKIHTRMHNLSGCGCGTLRIALPHLIQNSSDTCRSACPLAPSTSRRRRRRQRPRRQADRSSSLRLRPPPSRPWSQKVRWCKKRNCKAGNAEMPSDAACRLKFFFHPFLPLCLSDNDLGRSSLSK